jgi:hypothetical protein
MIDGRMILQNLIMIKLQNLQFPIILFLFIFIKIETKQENLKIIEIKLYAFNNFLIQNTQHKLGKTSFPLSPFPIP